MLKLRFLTSRRGNYHVTELLAGLCAAARDAGHDAEVASSCIPNPETGVAYVMVPGEYYGCEPASAWPSREQRERTVALCVESPFTPWFERLCRLAPGFPSVLAINRSSVVALRARGIEADHLQLGYTHHWDRWQGVDRPRPIDITYLGVADSRRDVLIAGYGRWWCERQTAILVPRLAPKPSARPDYVVDEGKYTHLARAKVLVNLHREGSSSLEWVRVLQAVANGCVVVSEPSLDHGPLQPGQHFVVAAAESIPHVVEGLLRDPERLALIRASAYRWVREQLDMSQAIEGLAVTAERLVSGNGASPPIADVISPDDPADPAAAPRAAPEDAVLRSAVRNLATETLGLRRTVQSLLERVEGRDPAAEPELVAQTPAFRNATPRVSVTITVHDYEREVVDALRSVEASAYDNFEVLVIDDASADNSLETVRDFLAERPWLPAALLRHRVNRGLGASRNALARQARGEMMFVLDADNTIHGPTIGRLVEALDRDRGATFAYPLIAVTRAGKPVGLLSRYAWDPEIFTGGNYIDAMALIRLDDFWAVGGYTEDPRLIGWEDFHLWCACAESDRRGVLVPEVLASYRRAEHSMLAWTETDSTTAWSLMHTRFPAIVPLARVG